MFLIVEVKGVNVLPGGMEPGAATLSSIPNSSPNNNMSRRQRFVSPENSPTRYGSSHVSNTVHRTQASGWSPVDGTTSEMFPVDSTEAVRKSRTLPPHSNKLLAENNNIPGAGTTVDGPGDMAAYGVAPKALSRDELTGTTDLDKGSVVEFDIGSERHCGVIRWIGYLSDKRHVIVGIELVINCLQAALLFSSYRHNIYLMQ